MIRRRNFIRRRPILESRGKRKFVRRRRPLFESRSRGELESLARAIALNTRYLGNGVWEVMGVLETLDRNNSDAIDRIFDEINDEYDGDMKDWGRNIRGDIFYDLEEELASVISSDDLFVMPIPEYLLPYLVNGDSSGLDDEELEQAEEIDRDYSVESPVHSYGEGYFDGYCTVQDYFVRPRKGRR